MGRMISIQMDSDDMINALNERVGYWTDDSDVLELFDQYYTNAVEGGCFDGCEFDVMSIVDNDYVNNTSIIYREEYEEISSLCTDVHYCMDKIKEKANIKYN